MIDALDGPLANTAAWQLLLDGQRPLFTELLDGATVALVARTVADAGAGPMLAWVAQDGRMTARPSTFAGYRDTVADLFMVFPEDTLAGLDPAAADPFGDLRDGLREGNIMLFVMRTKSDLIDRGWEDFCESLGLAFMGACR